MYRENTPIAHQQSANGAWWPALLEKAYAKMHQNYARLAGGLSFESLRTLTGMPVVAHLPMYFASKYTEDSVNHIIMQAAQRNHVINGGIFKDYAGLLAGHSYTIVGVVIAKDSQGKDVRLVKIKSPWATDKYTGPWHKDDPIWSEESKKQVLGALNVQDGTFFMPMSEFLKHFGQFAVAMVEDSWQVSRADIKLEKTAGKKMFVKFKNPVQQDFAATFEGLNARLLPENCAP